MIIQILLNFMDTWNVFRLRWSLLWWHIGSRLCINAGCQETVAVQSSLECIGTCSETYGLLDGQGQDWGDMMGMNGWIIYSTFIVIDQH